MDNPAVHRNNDANQQNENNNEIANEVNEVELNQDDEDDGDDESANNNDNIIDDDNVDDDDDDGENNNGVLDGGVAADCASHQESSNCPMVLYLECEFALSTAIPKGTTISIGLDKTTKLSAVFERFCVFVNTYKQEESRICVEMKDLEFLHCSILDPSDTVETAALMKNDRIKVYRNQVKRRKSETIFMKEKRDSDRLYFQQMRTLLPDLNPSPLKCDVIFHCKGKIKDEQGYKQEVLSTFVKGYSSILSRRCKWLSRQIMMARESDVNQDQRNNILPIYENSNNEVVVAIPEIDGAFVPWRVNENQNNLNNPEPGNIANPVEDDEDDHDYNRPYSSSGAISGDHRDNYSNDGIRSSSPIISFFGSHTSNALQVTLMHPPEAVKLLLEYCYTNRVVPLGYKAFKQSFKPIVEYTIRNDMREVSGPIAPFVKSSWPNRGLPTISLSVALAGIQLAEEAKLPRLSLMCEVAAAQLVNPTSVLKALALCEEQKQKTGNNLLYLRKEIMRYHILGHGRRGVNDLSSMPSWIKTLHEKSDVVVPSLMKGVKETILDEEKKFNEPSHKAREDDRMSHHFAELDEHDRKNREIERIERRSKQWLRQNQDHFYSRLVRDEKEEGNDKRKRKHDFESTDEKSIFTFNDEQE